MGSAGSQRSGLQKWRPTMKPLAVIKNIAETTATIHFRVPIPDSRLRVKISILFAFDASNQPSSDTVNITGNSLWLAESEDDDSGATGTDYPSVNIEGTVGAPTGIPLTAGLTGYSREFETAGDNINGILTVTNAIGFTGTWVLQLRYQPTAGQRFTDEEWQEIKNQARPIVPPPVQL